MQTRTLINILFGLSWAVVVAAQESNQTKFDSLVSFYVYPPPPAAPFTVPGTASANDFIAGGCTPGEPYMFFVHGWKEDCVNPQWIPDYRNNMRNRRGGCIVCLDYRYYSVKDYFSLTPYFNNLVKTLAQILKRFNDAGFLYSQGYLFGFSFGGQTVLSASCSLGYQLFSHIDVCEKAGPGFSAGSLPKPTDCAKNVQCVHTSWDKGQQDRNCHQDWSMGNCGRLQAGNEDYPKGHHGLCVWFWDYSFNTTFKAAPNKYTCTAYPLATYPPGYQLGYDLSKTSQVKGELFCDTSKFPPYNATS